MCAWGWGNKSRIQFSQALCLLAFRGASSNEKFTQTPPSEEREGGRRAALCCVRGTCEGWSGTRGPDSPRESFRDTVSNSPESPHSRTPRPSATGLSRTSAADTSTISADTDDMGGTVSVANATRWRAVAADCSFSSIGQGGGDGGGGGRGGEGPAAACAAAAPRAAEARAAERARRKRGEGSARGRRGCAIASVAVERENGRRANPNAEKMKSDSRQ